MTSPSSSNIDIDIIVPVYNALEDVKLCLRSILDNRCCLTIKLIVVNDCSGRETTNWLRHFSSTDPAIELIEHENNRGYSQACNTGLSHSHAPYVVLMNSDTIPSASWLSDLLACLESDKRIGIVSPLSNSAIKQSVPSLQDIFSSTAGIPSQKAVNEFADFIKEHSYSIYPIYPFIHGFCHLITRDVIATIGTIDSEAFPNGMGSEIEYCMRASSAGFLSAVADDTFVYHSKAKSLTSTSRLNEAWRDTIANQYGLETFQRALDESNHYPALDAIRIATSHSLFQQKLNNDISRFRFNSLVVLSVEQVFDFLQKWLPLLRAMRTDSVSWHIAIPGYCLDTVFKTYRFIEDINDLFIGYKDDTQLLTQVKYYDCILVNEAACLPWLINILDEYPDILPIVLLDNAWFCEEHEYFALQDHLQELRHPLLISNEATIAKETAALLGLHCWKLHNTHSDTLNFRERLELLWDSHQLLGYQPQAQSLLRLMNSHLVQLRLKRPTIAFDKRKPPTENFETLESRFAETPSLFERRMRKLIDNPHAWFADSGNALLRQLSHLFKSH